jgi:DNA invertase Pin-like site-specific DNA recombinase
MIGVTVMNVGYARVSSREQNEARQIQAFTELKVDRVFLDKLSGKNTDRPQLKVMLDFVRDGDTVTVESISRAARNTKDLLNIIDAITNKGAEFISLKESIDTRTPTGKFMLVVFGAMAELERESILQRQAEGIAIAKAAGKYKGKPKLMIDEEEFKRECKKWRTGKQTAIATMKKLNLKSNTFYRRVKEYSL